MCSCVGSTLALLLHREYTGLSSEKSLFSFQKQNEERLKATRKRWISEAKLLLGRGGVRADPWCVGRSPTKARLSCKVTLSVLWQWEPVGGLWGARDHFGQGYCFLGYMRLCYPGWGSVTALVAETEELGQASLRWLTTLLAPPQGSRLCDGIPWSSGLSQLRSPPCPGWKRWR